MKQDEQEDDAACERPAPPVEDLCHTTLDSLSDPIHVVDADLRILLVNETFRKWALDLGLGSVEAGQTLMEAFPFLPDGVRDQYRRVFDSAEALVTRETSTVAGREITTETHKIPIAVGGKVARVITIVRDVTEHERAEAALAESEHKYHQLFATVSDAIAILDAETRRFLDVNQAALDLYGYSREEFLKLTLADVASDPAVCGAVFQQALSGTAASANVGHHKRKDGTVFPVEISASAFDVGERRVVCGVVRDVTERTRAEAELRATLRQLRQLESIVNRSRAMVVLWRFVEGWPVEYCSENVRQLGYSAEDFVAGRASWPGMIHPDDIVHMETEVARHGREGVLVYRQRYRMINRAGEVRWMDDWSQAIQDEQGNVTHFQGIILDVTDRKQAEAALRESEAKYRLLAEHANDIVYSVDAAGVVTYVSPRVAHYGYRGEEMLSRRFLDFVWPADREAVAGKFAARLQRGDESPTEFRATDARGQPHWFEDRSRVRRDDTGAIVGLIGVLRDVTHRKQAEQASRDAHAKLVNAREDERRRLARELHDSVGQAMIAMHMRMQNIVADARADASPAVAESLGELATHCNQLIQEVRQISYGLFPPTLEQLGLPSALRQLRSVCELAGVHPVLRCGEDIRDVRFAGDAEIALFRIAQEAVHNALRHGECKQVEIDLHYADGRLVLVVADDGKGFDRAEALGKGMGLNSMKERCEAIGGTIEIASEPGQTRVEVSVPALVRRNEPPQSPGADGP